MSYEGYYQYLCENGHSFQGDCWETIEECPRCKGKVAWHNSVDETNCDGVGYIPMQKLLVKEAVSKTCDMGHPHIVEHEVYRIPSKEETKQLRTFRKDDEGSLFGLEDGKDTGLKMWGKK